ncbi:YfbM family protein [Streptomyces sp. TRM 70361]|uniref:YfbM family protein n=1 Tax=Streptomyces sp. TRM 70361 TaxID=3116553 RepID=UPI002E7B93F4|nr:YfbM family protein [Streptomyces sp. TRM 70361]MEE1941687.1 YfbM family protein [Streptomyces sp. TRM 70361]
MTGEYARLTPEQFQRALGDPEWAHELVLETGMAEWETKPEPGQARRLDVDKAWDGIRFLLERSGFLVDVVLGGELIPGAADWGYTPPRHLAPAEVAEVVGELAATPFGALVADLDPAELIRAGTYPSGLWDEGGADGLEYVRHHYEALRVFLAAAARDGDAVLLWIS